MTSLLQGSRQDSPLESIRVSVVRACTTTPREWPVAVRTWGVVLAVYLHSQRTMTRTSIFFRTLNVQGLTIAYREAGNPQKPKVVLLHGFPSSSHQYPRPDPASATEGVYLLPVPGVLTRAVIGRVDSRIGVYIK